MLPYQLGIDIGKDSFDVVLLGGRQRYRGQFDNNRAGLARNQSDGS